MGQVGRFFRGALTCALAACLTVGVAPAPALAAGEKQAIAARIAGANRYETMKWIVNNAFSSGPEWAVVATGEGFADALCASALAGARKCPVVLTAKGSLSPDTIDALQRTRAKRVYIVGGTSAVSSKVESGLKEKGIDVTRISGADRYSTSAAVAREVRRIASPKSVAVVTGSSFADALSLGPWCYATASPVLCVPKGGKLSGEALSEATSGGYSSAVIAGGKSAVSSSVESQLKGMSVERLAGKDRYETSARVAEWSCEHGLSWSTPAYATGRNYPDALAGAAAQGERGCPLLLADSASDATVALIKQHAKSVTYMYVLGGPSAVSDATVVAIRNAQGHVDRGDAIEALIPNAHPETCKAEWGPSVTCGVGEKGTIGDISSNDHTCGVSVADAFGVPVFLYSSKEKTTGPAHFFYLHVTLDKKDSNPNYDRGDVLADLERENSREDVHAYGLKELDPVVVSGMKVRVYANSTGAVYDGGYYFYPVDYVGILETEENRLTVHLNTTFTLRSDQLTYGDVCAELFRDYISDMTLKGI